MAKKRSDYTGLLAEPMPYMRRITPPGADPDRPPADFVEAGHAGLWRETVLRAQERDQRERNEIAAELIRRIEALCDHLGVDCGCRGWPSHLMFMLVARHEPEFMKSTSGWFTDLCLSENIDPYSEDADLELAMCLALRHVPAFSTAPPPVDFDANHVRLNTLELVKLLMAFAAILAWLSERGEKVTERAVVNLVLNKKALSRIIPPAAAAALHDVLATKKNKRVKPTSTMNEKTLRNYLRDAMTARAAVVDGKATSFQKQIVFDVIPFIDRLKQRLDGQTAAGEALE